VTRSSIISLIWASCRALPLQNPEATLCALHPPSRAGSRPLIHLAGSYAYPGIPLLEGCVGSAKRVVEEILEQHSGHERDEKSRGGAVDKLDWTAGDGSFLGRAWRWRRKGGLT